MNKKIIITGATGLIGRRLVNSLTKRGDHVIAFTRNIAKENEKIFPARRVIEWDYHNLDIWKDFLDGVDAVIHLAGANLAGRRWNKNYKKEIRDSRIISTRNLVKAISEVETKPQVFICSSATGYYGNGGNEEFDESSTCGNDFLAQLCKDWEAEAGKIEAFNVRRVSVRTGIVLSKEAGALKQMLPPFKLFLGGPLGNGRQWFPWIHIDDIVGIYLFLLDNTNMTGAVNASSPNPVTMKEFAQNLGNILHRPSIFTVPQFILKIVAGEIAGSINASLKVNPKKLLESGFEFKFKKLNEALEDLLLK